MHTYNTGSELSAIISGTRAEYDHADDTDAKDFTAFFFRAHTYAPTAAAPGRIV